jgi:hypothetical protein
MKQGEFIREDRLLRQAIDVLMQELGPVETNRFLSLPARERMESVRRHQKWQSALNNDVFLNEVFGSQ